MSQYASVLADPWRSLAAGVVLQAVEDARVERLSVNRHHAAEQQQRRDAAREWLQGGEALEWWCAAAGVDAEAVAERFR